jgi:hypothetical protein
VGPWPDADNVDRKQWVILGGLSLSGAIGVGRGLVRGDAVLIGLWTVYVVRAGAFVARVVR